MTALKAKRASVTARSNVERTSLTTGREELSQVPEQAYWVIIATENEVRGLSLYTQRVTAQGPLAALELARKGYREKHSEPSIEQAVSVLPID